MCLQLLVSYLLAEAPFLGATIKVIPLRVVKSAMHQRKYCEVPCMKISFRLIEVSSFTLGSPVCFQHDGIDYWFRSVTVHDLIGIWEVSHALSMLLQAAAHVFRSNAVNHLLASILMLLQRPAAGQIDGRPNYFAGFIRCYKSQPDKLSAEVIPSLCPIPWVLAGE